MKLVLQSQNQSPSIVRHGILRSVAGVLTGGPPYQFSIFQKVRYEGVARVQQSDCPVCSCGSDVLFTIESLQSGWPPDGLQLELTEFGFIWHLPEIRNHEISSERPSGKLGRCLNVHIFGQDCFQAMQRCRERLK